MQSLGQFTDSLDSLGFDYFLKREDGIPFLEIHHKDFRLMTFDAAMFLGRTLKHATKGLVRFHSLECQSVNFMVYTPDMDVSNIDPAQLYGADIDEWLAGVREPFVPMRT